MDASALGDRVAAAAAAARAAAAAAALPAGDPGRSAAAAAAGRAPSPPRPSPPPSPTVFVTLQLTVDNVYSTAGHVLVWVHTSSSTWPDKGGAYYFERLTVPSSKEVSLAVEVPAGEIAVMSYHDKNDNLKMDTNWIGYPEEGAAASNGARGGPLGGPKWSDAKVAVAAGAPVSLELSMWTRDMPSVYTASARAVRGYPIRIRPVPLRNQRFPSLARRVYGACATKCPPLSAA